MNFRRVTFTRNAGTSQDWRVAIGALDNGPFLHVYPSVAVALPMALASLTIVLVSGPPTPSLLVDGVVFLVAAVCSHRLCLGTAGVAIMLAVYRVLPETRPTMGEHASFVPVLCLALANRPRAALAFGIWATALNTPRVDDLAKTLPYLMFWAIFHTVAWMSGRLWVAHDQHRERELKAQLSDQRMVIAREIHDTVAHEVSRLSMTAQLMSTRGGATPDDLAFIVDACDRVMAQMRATLVVLRSPVSETPIAATGPEDLAEAVSRAKTRLRDAGFRPTVSIEQLDRATTLQSWGAQTVLREGVNNIVTHGSPKEPVLLDIGVAPDGDLTLFLVNGVDRPRGLASRSPTFGLIGLRERVEATGGTLHGSLDDETWTLIAVIPGEQGARRRAEPD